MNEICQLGEDPPKQVEKVKIVLNKHVRGQNLKKPGEGVDPAGCCLATYQRVLNGNDSSSDFSDDAMDECLVKEFIRKKFLRQKTVIELDSSSMNELLNFEAESSEENNSDNEVEVTVDASADKEVTVNTSEDKELSTDTSAVKELTVDTSSEEAIDSALLCDEEDDNLSTPLLLQTPTSYRLKKTEIDSRLKGQNCDELVESMEFFCQAQDEMFKTIQSGEDQTKKTLIRLACAVGESFYSVLDSLGLINAEVNPEDQKKLIDLALSVATSTDGMVRLAKVIAGDSKSKEEQEKIISVALFSISSTSRMQATFKILAPTFNIPACQDKLKAAAKEVSRAVENCVIVSKKITVDAKKLKELVASSKNINKALDDLQNHLKSDLYGADMSIMTLPDNDDCVNDVIPVNSSSNISHHIYKTALNNRTLTNIDDKDSDLNVSDVSSIMTLPDNANRANDFIPVNSHQWMYRKRTTAVQNNQTQTIIDDEENSQGKQTEKDNYWSTSNNLKKGIVVAIAICAISVAVSHYSHNLKEESNKIHIIENLTPEQKQREESNKNNIGSLIAEHKRREESNIKNIENLTAKHMQREESNKKNIESFTAEHKQKEGGYNKHIEKLTAEHKLKEKRNKRHIKNLTAQHKHKEESNKKNIESLTAKHTQREESNMKNIENLTAEHNQREESNKKNIENLTAKHKQKEEGNKKHIENLATKHKQKEESLKNYINKLKTDYKQKEEGNQKHIENLTAEHEQKEESNKKNIESLTAQHKQREESNKHKEESNKKNIKSLTADYQQREESNMNNVKNLKVEHKQREESIKKNIENLTAEHKQNEEGNSKHIEKLAAELKQKEESNNKHIEKLTAQHKHKEESNRKNIESLTAEHTQREESNIKNIENLEAEHREREKSNKKNIEHFTAEHAQNEEWINKRIENLITEHKQKEESNKKHIEKLLAQHKQKEESNKKNIESLIAQHRQRHESKMKIFENLAAEHKQREESNKKLIENITAQLKQVTSQLENQAVPGDNDAKLKWPMKRRVTLSLLDQTNGSRTYKFKVQTRQSYPELLTFNNPSENPSVTVSRYPTFVSHETIKTRYFIRKYSKFVKVTVK